MKEAMMIAECAENGKKLDLPPQNTLLPTNFDLLAENIELSNKP